MLLTTFRTTGVPVSTPVWIGQDGDTLLVTTRAGSGKVKRLRNSGRVELTPCDIRGNVADGAATVSGTAEVFTDPDSRATLTAIFEEKYATRWHEMRAADAKRDTPPVSATLRITLAWLDPGYPGHPARSAPGHPPLASYFARSGTSGRNPPISPDVGQMWPPSPYLATWPVVLAKWPVGARNDWLSSDVDGPNAAETYGWGEWMARPPRAIAVARSSQPAARRPRSAERRQHHVTSTAWMQHP